MKNKVLITIVAFTMFFVACQKADFAESYADPSKISQSTVEKQFAGFTNSLRGYILPQYRNFFVVLRSSLQRYNQAVGWINEDNQYQPPSAGIIDRWNAYYNGLAQYRELEKIHAELKPEDQTDRRIYMIAATILLYDHTQRVVDLHGDIPFSEAGKLSTNGGEYQKSYAKYDGAEAIYTKMLDDLKGFADELNTITVKAGILTGFKNQDIINKGDLVAWKRYVNSLRLRMLTRVSGASAFSGRATAEISAILGDAAKYPVVSKNTENIQITVTNLNTDINSKEFREGLEGFAGNLAGKTMIDHMKKNVDPRLRALFEPGLRDSSKTYIGLDPMLDQGVQTVLFNGGTIAIYNRSTLSRNQFFPGLIVTASEVNLLAAEYYLKLNNDASAKAAYENAIKNSIEFYYNVRKVSNDNVAGDLKAYTEAEVSAYLASNDIAWDTPGADKLSLIANQKWLHFNVLMAVDSWSEMRRLGLPKFTFRDDPSNAQKQPPFRWFYPTTERTFNGENYGRVQGNDVLNKKLFWAK
jgi:Starch-binding associating with outer membrane